jgi:hypothetical protein
MDQITMVQILELLKEMKAERNANKQEAKAERNADKREMKADKEEMMAKMDANQEETKTVTNSLWPALEGAIKTRVEMKSCREVKHACLEEEKESTPEKTGHSKQLRTELATASGSKAPQTAEETGPGQWWAPAEVFRHPQTVYPSYRPLVLVRSHELSPLSIIASSAESLLFTANSEDFSSNSATTSYGIPCHHSLH